MEGAAAAAAMGTLGFWIFLAAVVVAGVWQQSRKRESEQETLRRIVESGREIDPAVIDRILGVGDGKDAARDLKVAATIVLLVAPGLAALGLALGMDDAGARRALLGIAVLVAFVGIGLYLAARQLGRRDSDRQA